MDIIKLWVSSLWNERVEDNDVNLIQQLHKDPHRGTRVEDNDVNLIQQLHKDPHRGTRVEDNDVDIIQ